MEKNVKKMMMISIIILGGCTTPNTTSIKPSNTETTVNQVRVNHRVSREEPYMANFGVHQSQFYSCLSTDGTRSMPCMIKRAKNGLYEFNQRVTELNRALGDCGDCGY